MKLSELQQRQAAWSKHNFPHSTVEHCELGTVEEQGELCDALVMLMTGRVGKIAHALLKQSQGIRGTAAEHEALAKDSIGDVIIYLADYCTRRGADLWCDADFYGDSFVDMQEYIGPYVSEAQTALIKYTARALSEDNIDPRRVLLPLATLCTLRGWDLDAIVTETWASVERRDWVKFPRNGLTE